MEKEEEAQDKTTDFQVSDRRFWVENEESIEEAADLEPKYPSVVEELKARTEAAEEKLKERLQQLDEENASFRSRISKNLERRVQDEKAEFVKSLLEVLDNFQRAIVAAERTSDFEGLLQGVKLNFDLLLKRFQEAGVEPIDILNSPFDPNEAEALGMVEVSDPDLDDKVVEIFQQGYRLGERVIRPATVNVGKFRE
jgi:molecular chaperone GrpE